MKISFVIVSTSTNLMSRRVPGWSKLQESPYMVRRDSEDAGEDGLHKGRTEPEVGPYVDARYSMGV